MSSGLYTRQFGHGPRHALAVHCTLAHSGAWRGVGEALADELTLLCPDLPSHGKSADWDGQGDLHARATDLVRELVTEPIDIIGHSFGATIGLRIAIENPELVRSLTMIEPVYFAAALADDPARVAAADRNSGGFDAAFDAGDRMEAARIFNTGWGDGSGWEQTPEKLRQYMADRIHYVPASQPFLRDDNAGLLEPGKFARAAMPVLLMDGGTSADMVDAISTSIARRLPNATRKAIEGAGHMAPITHPQAVAAEIRSFLETV
ncbi:MULTISPECIES: alpha/beta fold hydrolase [unclassified Sulfitobacter]|uniref:alpha/beta fold hydrolase n=1 Tax=Sulfitobacter TaxID=60136 RepID=UPI00032670BD|nr:MULTISPECIES: alpha/beta hydrolase [unclassified Sulfitobacter]AXI51837.1 alpha/beta hydrolase [Sulfitobacter sp. SK025]